MLHRMRVHCGTIQHYTKPFHATLHHLSIVLQMSAMLFAIEPVHFTISCSNSTLATTPFLIWLNYSCSGCSVSWTKTKPSIIWPCHSFTSYTIPQLIFRPALYLLIYWYPRIFGGDGCPYWRLCLHLVGLSTPQMSKIFGKILWTVTDKVNVTTQRFLPLEHNEKKQNISEKQCKIKIIRHFLKTCFDSSSDIFISDLYKVKKSKHVFKNVYFLQFVTYLLLSTPFGSVR